MEYREINASSNYPLASKFKVSDLTNYLTRVNDLEVLYKFSEEFLPYKELNLLFSENESLIIEKCLLLSLGLRHFYGKNIQFELYDFSYFEVKNVLIDLGLQTYGSDDANLISTDICDFVFGPSDNLVRNTEANFKVFNLQKSKRSFYERCVPFISGEIIFFCNKKFSLNKNYKIIKSISLKNTVKKVIH